MSEFKSDITDVKFTHLGHAGMIFENNDVVIISDPWITPGSFDDSWFQYPRNDHMGDVIRAKIDDKTKDTYIFVSHEHLDHYDPKFLNSLQNRDFTIIIANYRRPFMLEWFKKYECKNIICLDDATEYVIDKNVKFTLCVEDCEMNRDCGILVKMNQYVLYNGNDCKYPYYEKLSIYGDLDIFAQQFSGATWHPVCYDYDKEHMDLITIKKRNTKRQTLIKYIKNLGVKMYVPCAGPPVFLDPELIHFSLARFTIFPRADWVKDRFYEEFGDKLKCHIFMPGDVYSLNQKKMVFLDERRVDDRNQDDFEKYLKKYQHDYKHIFEKRSIENKKVDKDVVFERLIVSLQERLDTIKDCDLSKSKIFETNIELHDYDKKIVIDFDKMELSVKSCEDYKDRQHIYVFKTDAWQIKKVLDGQLTWEEMMITFRPKLSRSPDVFSTLLNAFLFQQTEDVIITFNLILSTINSNDKIVIETPEGEYYEICKKCPHQGQDLMMADIEDSQFLICPKHCWKFDLKNHGKSLTTHDSLNAVKIKKPKNKKIYSLKPNEYDFLDFVLQSKELFVKSKINKPIYKLLLRQKTNEKFKLCNTDHIIMKINNISRPYTFIYENGLLAIYIKLYHDGQMSQQVREVKENDLIQIKKYKTQIEFDKIKNYNNIVLIAGGTGITPFFRIIQHFIKTKNIDIIYCNTLKDEILLKDEINKFEKLKINYYNSDEKDGHINKNYIANLININENIIYCICGPPGFSKNISDIFIQLNVPQDNIILFDM